MAQDMLEIRASHVVGVSRGRESSLVEMRSIAGGRDVINSIALCWWAHKSWSQYDRS